VFWLEFHKTSFWAFRDALAIYLPLFSSALCDKKTWIIKTTFPIILIAMLAKHVAEDAVEVLEVMFGSAWKSWRKWQAQGKWM